MDQETREYFEEFAKSIFGRFDSVEQRFVSVEQRFDSVEQRFDLVEQRFVSVEQRFDLVEQRFVSVEQHFDLVEQRFDSVEQRFEGRFQSIEGQLQEFRQETAQRFEQVETQIRHTNVLFEGLRGEVQLLAEGLDSANGRLDRLEQKVDRLLDEERADRKSSDLALDGRIRGLEKPRG